MINLNATTPTLAISDSFFSSMERLPGKTISKVAKFIKNLDPIRHRRVFTTKK